MKKAISILMMLLSLAGVQQSLAKDKPRVIILTDGEVDDRCSMVHLLLYANDCDIAALIESWKSHSALTLLAKQDCSSWP